jgi:uncharacterized membrane protein YphA (DoxX/SURF4 family)
MTGPCITERIGRMALAGIFLKGGWDAFHDPGQRPAKAAKLGFPAPEVAVRANGAAMVVGGTALAAGLLPRAAAAGLLCSLIPTTLAGHPFWDEEDPVVRAQQLTQFLKNLGIAGGLLLVASAPRCR